MNIEELVKTRGGANVLVMGPPAHGKTGLIAGLLNGGKKGVIITSQPNALVLYSRLTEAGKKNILDVYDLTEKFSVKLATTKDNFSGVKIDCGGKPMVYDRLLDNISEQWCISKPDGKFLPPYKDWDKDTFIAIDDMTALAEDICSPCRLIAMHEKGYLGGVVTDDKNMQLTGWAQKKLSYLLATLFTKPGRKYHIFINAHVKQRKVNITNQMTHAEIVKVATASKAEAPRMGVSVTTTDYYPVVIGDALTENFGRFFNWIVLMNRKVGGIPVCKFNETDDYPIMFRTPHIPNLEKEKSVEEAGCYIIDQHNQLFN